MSLPSPLQPSPSMVPDLEASICNLSSPAAFSPPFQRAVADKWAIHGNMKANSHTQPILRPKIKEIAVHMHVSYLLLSVRETPLGYAADRKRVPSLDC